MTTGTDSGDESKVEKGNSGRQKSVIVAAIVLFTGVAAACWLPVPMALAAMLAVLCISLWATALVPEYWPALLFFLLALLLNLAPAEVVFSGFYSSTFWLLFGGLVLGAAIRHTGLGQRAAGVLVDLLARRYSKVITVIVLFSLALAFILPSSMGRVALLIPVILALSEQMGYGPDSNGRLGMLLAATLGTFMPAFAILPANAPNMILAGLSERLYQLPLSYWDYLLLHFPVLGGLKALLIILSILWLFPDRDPVHSATEDKLLCSVSSKERQLMYVLGFCLLWWLTDAVHHISPGWIAFAAALYCLLPATGLTSRQCINQEVSYGSLFFVAGLLGVGAVISYVGLGEHLINAVAQSAGFSSLQAGWGLVGVIAAGIFTALVAGLPGVPAIITPVAGSLSELTQLPLVSVIMVQVLAFSSVLLPYQAPPLIMAMQLGGISFRAISKACLILFAASVFILFPLDLLWWRLLGMF